MLKTVCRGQGCSLWTRLAIAVIFAAVGGCQKYTLLANSAADRIWLVTQDGTEVFRCWDLKNQTRKPIAMCRRAEMLGISEETDLSIRNRSRAAKNLTS